MKAETILEALRLQGATPNVEGGELRIQAPRGLPSTLVTAIREHKPAIVAHLQVREAERQMEADLRRLVSADEARHKGNPPPAGYEETLYHFALLLTKYERRCLEAVS